MPRYLQKLVARGGVAPLTSSLQPAFRTGAPEFATPDALPESVEPFVPRLPALHETGASAGTVEGASTEAPAHAIESRGPAVTPAPQFLGKRVEPRLLSHEAIPHQGKRPAEVRLDPPHPLEIPRIAPALAPPISQGTPPVATVISPPETRETATKSAHSSQSRRTKERPPVGEVLSQLMPHLDVWFNQPSPADAQPENDASQPRLSPPLREPEISAPPPAEEPRLVIGQIRVDVLPAPVPTPPLPVVRIPVRTAHPPAAAGTIAKLGFGLGQM